MRTYTIAEIEAAVRTVESAAFPVSPRVLRRVITQDLGLTGWHVPHRKCWILSADRARQMVEPDELGLPNFRGLSAVVMLLARPDEEELEKLTTEELFVHYWRLLFHVRIDVAMQQAAAAGRLEPALLRERIEQLGQVEFDEVYAVLQREQFLDYDAPRGAAWREFVAVFFELQFFSPHWLPVYFPTMSRWEAAEHLLSADLNPAEILAATRLPGGPESPILAPPEVPAAVTEWWQLSEATVPVPLTVDQAVGLRTKANRRADEGNAVRAARMRLEAARATTGVSAEGFRESAKGEMERLATRLQAALGFAADEVADWSRLLTALLGRSRRGFWNPDARLLYDLQKVALSAERQVYTIDTFRWVRSLGRRRLRRELPHLREVAICRDLHTAIGRLPASQLDEADRARLSQLLHQQTELAEKRLRDSIRPEIEYAIRKVGLTPANIPEQVALRKVVEELLDEIVDRGYFNMGQLRDVISRNNFKMRDLMTFRDLWFGGQLLELDGRLDMLLEGVYHRGEFYLRWLQGLSTVAFGTGIGRFLTKYLVIPYGGAYLALSGAIHIKDAVASQFFSRDTGAQVSPAGAKSQEDSAESRLANLKADDEEPDPKVAVVPSPPPEKLPVGDPPIDKSGDSGDEKDPDPAEKVAASSSGFLAEVPLEHAKLPLELLLPLGTFLLALIHVRAFREFIIFHFKTVYQIVRGILIDAPARFLKLEAVKAFLRSKWVVMIRRQVIVPLFLTLVTWLRLPETVPWKTPLQTSIAFGMVFLAFNLAVNTRLVRSLEEAFFSSIERTWYTFRVRLAVALFEFVMEFFKRAMEWIERFLYAVDEWLRFKTGETRITLLTKAVLGSVWGLIAYVIRFAVTLLIEPQINPFKHFPVVTVSHKMILPLAPTITAHLIELGILKERAVAIATGVVFGSPGMFGFLVWELKENWRLFSANRKPQLGSVPVGSHGETIPRLLRPGLHSGVLPRLHDRLRKTARHTNPAAGLPRRTKDHEREHHLRQALERFVERELISLLRAEPLWQTEIGHWECTAVRLGATNIGIELSCPKLGNHPLMLSLEEQSGWIVARIVEAGWIRELPAEPRRLFQSALLGFYKMCGVEIVREQIEMAIRREIPYDILADQLVLWPGGQFEHEAVYSLDETRQLSARPARLSEQFHLPRFHPDEIIFDRLALPWSSWVAEFGPTPISPADWRISIFRNT